MAFPGKIAKQLAVFQLCQKKSNLFTIITIIFASPVVKILGVKSNN